MTLKKYLDSEDFYNLMQTYRHTKVMDQQLVVDAFETVKKEVLLAAHNSLEFDYAAM